MRAFGMLLDNASPDICINYTSRNCDQHVTIPSTGETVTVYRFREGIERFFVTDINNPALTAALASGIPVMWDTVRTDNGAPVKGEVNHLPLAANVLFMDGHVEFAHYPQPAGSNLWMLTKEAQTEGLKNFP